MEEKIRKIILSEEMKKLNEPYKPTTLAVLNDKAWVQLSLHKGEFPHGMHYHENDDELFICVKGEVDIEMEDRIIHLSEGEILNVKAGQKHMPVAKEDCYLIRIKTSVHMEAVLKDGSII